MIIIYLLSKSSKSHTQILWLTLTSLPLAFASPSAPTIQPERSDSFEYIKYRQEMYISHYLSTHFISAVSIQNTCILLCITTFVHLCFFSPTTSASILTSQRTLCLCCTTDLMYTGLLWSNYSYMWLDIPWKFGECCEISGQSPCQVHL